MNLLVASQIAPHESILIQKNIMKNNRRRLFQLSLSEELILPHIRKGKAVDVTCAPKLKTGNKNSVVMNTNKMFTRIAKSIPC